jgi:hypothetical protein
MNNFAPFNGLATQSWEFAFPQQRLSRQIDLHYWSCKHLVNSRHQTLAEGQEVLVVAGEQGTRG